MTNPGTAAPLYSASDSNVSSPDTFGVDGSKSATIGIAVWVVANVPVPPAIMPR